jgi:hypothetical protein
MFRTFCRPSFLSAVGLALLSYPSAPAHGQARMNLPRTFMVPSVRAMPTPTMPNPTVSTRPAQVNTNSDQLMRRDVLLDYMLLGELRRDALARQYYGRYPYSQSGGYGSYGSSGYPTGVGGYGYPTSGTTATTPGTYVASPVSSREEAARAALTMEQVVTERLANRRRAFDESIYEREKTLTPEQELLLRSRTNPGPGEVASGESLNALLVQLRRPVAGIDMTSRLDVPLPFDGIALKHINVTRGTGNIAVLRNGGRLNWPTALLGSAFQQPRERLESRAAEAVRQAVRSGRVDQDTIWQMSDDVERLRQILVREAKEFIIEPYIEAKTYLRNLDDALVALQQPDAANHFTGTYELRATTVLALVNQMTRNALRFAPAVSGDEPFYAVLHESLAACDRAAFMQPKEMR